MRLMRDELRGALLPRWKQDTEGPESNASEVDLVILMLLSNQVEILKSLMRSAERYGRLEDYHKLKDLCDRGEVVLDIINRRLYG